MRASICLLLAACVEAPSTTATSNDLLAGGMPELPSATGAGALSPWGGGDPARWRPEAILANATSRALNDAWSRTDITDAIVAVPVRMLDSSFYEFGDGQANTAPSFEYWHEARPPVVATLVVKQSGSLELDLRGDHALPNTDSTWDLRYVVNGTPRTVPLPVTRDASGDALATWAVPAELGWSSRTSTQVALVHPHTWGDWFPLMFRFPVKPIGALAAEIPPALSHFADGGGVQDHEGVSVQTHSGAGTPFERLSAHVFGGGYNQSPFTPPDIHAVFPYGGHQYVTGVGMGWTWVANTPSAPFKIMYTCFDKRNAAAEASAPDGGVASGGGWHRIGDPAETVLNDLEGGPLVLGSAMSNPATLPSGGFAYNLADVATVRWVKPGEAFVTPTGDGQHNNYHWYFFAGDKPVCTEEWVHPCRPVDYGFACASTDSVTFHADSAATIWGQNVYVVGDRAELGGWDPNRAIALGASAYPTWTGTVALPRGAAIQFKFIKKDGSGNVTWEGGGNRTLTVPDAATASAGGGWQ